MSYVTGASYVIQVSLALERAAERRRHKAQKRDRCPARHLRRGVSFAVAEAAGKAQPSRPLAANVSREALISLFCAAPPH